MRAGTGNIVEAVRHLRTIRSQIRRLTTLSSEELVNEAKELGAPLSIVKTVAETGKLPVPCFAAGGIATPADAALCRWLGAESVFVGSGIFKSGNPEVLARAIVKATTYYEDNKALLESSRDLGEPMKGIEIKHLSPDQRLQERGW
jgi:pyridoxal 5'-phosphate synthase pdxS subunit